MSARDHERQRYNADHYGYGSPTANEVEREHVASVTRDEVVREGRFAAELLGVLSPVQRALFVLMLSTLSLSSVRKILTIFVSLFGVTPATRFLGIWLSLCRRTPAMAPGSTVDTMDDLTFHVLGHPVIDRANGTTCTDADGLTLVDRMQERAFEVREREKWKSVHNVERDKAQAEVECVELRKQLAAARSDHDHQIERMTRVFSNAFVARDQAVHHELDALRVAVRAVRDYAIRRRDAFVSGEFVMSIGGQPVDVKDALLGPIAELNIMVGRLGDALGPERPSDRSEDEAQRLAAELAAANETIAELRKTACLCTFGPASAPGQQCAQCAKVTRLYREADQEGRRAGIEQCRAALDDAGFIQASWFVRNLSPERGAEPGAVEGMDSSAASMGVRNTAGGATPPDGSSGVSASPQLLLSERLEALRRSWWVLGDVDALLGDVDALLGEAQAVARRDELGGVP